MRFVVAPVTEFPPGTRRIVRVGGREIGVFRVGEDFYAVRNRCPHQGAPLCQGTIQPRYSSDVPGVITHDATAPLVMCPWHGWQYDARTGEAFSPGDARVRSYGVTVESGRALEKKESGEDVQFVAETFPVRVEDDYVVLDA
jgi:3-phenylpropionate/trans-cinnamate dioxygenase ferredoxin subunit